MKPYHRILVALALSAIVALVVRPSLAEDANPTIKEIMGKANKGPKALVNVLGKDLNAETPDWEKIQKESKELVLLSVALTKNKPTKGEQASWDSLSKDYLESAKSLDDAAEKKDKKEAVAAQAKLSLQATCKACHSVHKG